MCFTVHIIFTNFDNYSPDLGGDICLAPEGFKRSFSGPWPKKVVHHCTKAFDSIRHEAITQPLSILEMPDSIYNWLVRYHEDQRHVTIFNGSSSKVAIINASVVQGSVLGPSEYILGAADLHSVSDKNRLLKYADDSYLLIGSQNITTAQHEIQNITSWAKSKNLFINDNKTREMAIIRKNKASLATQPSVTGTTRVTSMKILRSE